MGKISKQVSKGLGAAIQEAKSKIAGEDNTQDNEQVTSFDVNDLLNAGVEAHNSRKKKKKETPLEESVDKGFQEKMSFTHEEVCENEMKQALEKGLPDPDFDFRNFYEPGHKAYYVRVSEILGEKEVVPVTLRTIYARTMIGSEEKGLCHCIGYNQKDCVFETPRDANAYCDSLVLNAKYKPEPKRTKDDIPEEEDDDYKQEVPNLDDD